MDNGDAYTKKICPAKIEIIRNILILNWI